MKLVKSKFFLALAIALGIIACATGITLISAPMTALAAEVEYGSGTESDIYLISSANELYALSQTNSDWGKNFKLTQDIDLSTVCYEGKSWMPIGNDTNKFTGTFDGDDHTISGLYIDSTEGWQGLFGYVENGTIKNLTVKGTVSGKGYVGGIVGYFDVGTVEKCSFEGAVKGGSSSQPVGGIVGYNRGGTIKKCSNRGEVSCWSEYAGGIVGQNYGLNAKVIDCENTGTISLIDSTGKSSTVGGIVGINVSSSKIINCRNTGTIGEGNNLIVGGIVGKNNGASVTQCYNTGIVTGKDYIGGVAGQNIAQATITECYNTGAVSGSQYIGGVAGQNDDGATIMSCYNTATVTGSSNVGGVAGQNYGGTSKRPTLGTVKNCYNRGTVTGNNSGGVVGLNKINNSEGKVENCYYLTDTASGGGAAGALVKTQNEFASGEVSWLLQKWQPDYGIQVWGQLLKGNEHEIEKYPVLTDQLPKRVWKTSFIKNGANIYDAYVNNGGTVTPPAGDEWYESNGALFNSTVQITEDKILGLRVRFGAVTGNLITLDYGQSAEQNLDEWLEYEDGSSTEDKFSYTITDYDGLTGAYLEGSLLKIPSGANVKEGGYVLQIKAHEKMPCVDTAVTVATLSATNFGTEDVTFTVQIVINKIDQAPLIISGVPAVVTYLDSFVLTTQGGNGTGAVSWEVTEGKDYATINANGEVAIKGVGFVEITATKSGGINYNDVTDKISFTINKANQGSFTIKELPQSVTYKDASFTLEAEGGTGNGAVTWEVTSGQNLAEINANGVVTIKGAGIIEITATKAGGDNYYDISDKISITINKANQDDFKITGLPQSVTYGDEDFTLATEGGTGTGAVAWEVTAGKDYAAIDANGKVSIKGAGVVEITATKAGGDNYNDIIDIIRFTIYKANQEAFKITGLPGNVTYGDKDIELSAEGGSGGGAVTWEVTAGNDYAAIDANGSVTIKGAGIVEITATKAEDANFKSISDKIIITINKANQPDFKITGLPQSVTFGDKDVELSTEGGIDGGTVTWEVTEGKTFAEIDADGNVTIKGVGYVVITATKAGGDNYNDIFDVIHFTVNKANQAPFTIKELPFSVTFGDKDFDLATEGGTGNGEITWSVTVGGEFVVVDEHGKVTIKGAGYVEITATKAGGDNYNDISDTIDFTINKANQTEFKITGLPGYIEYEDSFTLQTDGGSGTGAITWEVTAGGEYAEIDERGNVTIKGVGYVEITATKASDANYNAAIAMISFTATKENQDAFAITGLPASVTYQDSFTLGVSGGSGNGEVTWEVTLGREYADINAEGKVTIKGVGYVEITATKSGGANYNNISDRISFTVNKANQPDFRIISLPSYIEYEDSFTLKTDGVKGKGAITWAVTAGGEYADINSEGKVTITGVGYVEITATIAGDENFNAAVALVSFTVNKENQAEFTITGLPASVAYDDVFTLQAKGGTGAGAVMWKVTVGNEFAEIEEATGKVTIKGVGYVEITATKSGGENYNDISDRISFTVNKANQPDFRIIELPSYIKYEDVFTLKTDGVKGQGAITWAVTEGRAYADVAPNGKVTITGVGYVEITATIASDGNYNAAIAMVSFTVNKENQAAFTITGLPASIAYEDVFTLGTTGGTGGGAVSWAVTVGREYADINAEGKVTVKGVGYVEITATKSGGDNYNDISDKVSFTVNKANQEALTISGLLNSVTYGDKDFLLTVSGGSGNGAISWDYTGKVTISVAQNVATITVNGAGEVTITATKAEDEHYKAISTVITFTVNKANQADFNIIKLPAGVTYTDAPFTIEADGGSGEGVVTWQKTGKVSLSADGKFATITVNGAGEVTITATKAGDDNFNAVTTVVSFTINKANQEAFTIAGVPNSVTYGDKDLELYAVGGSGTGKVTWAVTSGNAFAEIDKDGKVTIKGAGEVTITAIKAEDDNYNSTPATISFTINKANQADFNIVGLPVSITFNDGAFTLTAEGGSGDGAVTWDFTGKVSLDTVGKTATVTTGGAGRVTITATKAGDNNYNAISTVISFTVNKANQNALIISGLPLGVNYKSAGFTLIAEGGSVVGDVIWQVSEGSDFVTINANGEVTIKGAGRVEITAIKAGGENYNDISSIISFTVEKVTPEYTIPEGLTAAYGDTLGQVALPAGWAWDDALSTKVGEPGVHSFSATFTHSEAANYNTVTVLLTVTVEKATPDYTLPANLTATYGDTLGQVALPAGWAWNDALTTKVGNAGTRTFSATFTPSDAAHYHTVTIVLAITVKKAIPQFTLPDGLKATVGDTLGDVALPAGWTWNDALTTKVGKAGQRTFTATFTPSDTENYETVTIVLTITVEAKSASSFWWWWILLLIVLLIFVLFVVLLIVRNRNKESSEVAETENTTSQPQAVLQTAGEQQATKHTPAENVPPAIAKAPQTPVTHIEPVGIGVADIGIPSAPRYKKSFTAHLIQASDTTKLWYSDIKNQLLAYKKIHNRTSWEHETFRYGRKTIAKLIFRGKTLCLYLALNVADYTGQYPIEDAAQKSAKYAATPLLIRLKNNKRMKIAKPLIAEAMHQNGIEPLPGCAYVDYCVPYESTEELVAKGFVKRTDKTNQTSSSDES